MKSAVRPLLLVWSIVVLVAAVAIVGTDADDALETAAPSSTTTVPTRDELDDVADIDDRELGTIPDTIAPTTPTIVAPSALSAPTSSAPRSTISTTTTTMANAASGGGGSTGVSRTTGEVLLVWTSGGLPDGFSRDVAAIAQVTAHTTVRGDLVRLLATNDRSGARVDTAPEGWAWPIDALAVDPASYGSFQTADDAIASLAPGGAVLSATSAALRRIGVGGTVTLAGGTVTVQAVVDDRSTGGAELLVHLDDAARLGIDDERFMLLTDSDRAAVEDQIRAHTPPGTFLSLRGEAETTYLRHGDRVDPQMFLKQTFGEFLFQDAGGREIRIHPAWLDANIVTESVPLLGPIRCHRTVIPLVRAAMEEVEAAGKGHTVDPDAFAGCHYARRIGPGAGLSRHSWGTALDINIGSNPRGTYDSQDPALIAAMRRQGFHWGGDWEYPDPGHYEAKSPR